MAVITLGCPRNLADSLEYRRELEAAGLRLVADPDLADALVVNTCAFVREAREESLEVLREAVCLKRGGVKAVVAAGCMAERVGESLLEAVPELDAVVGLGARGTLAARLLDLLEVAGSGLPKAGGPVRETRLPGGEVWAPVKLGEGCNRSCTFCAIPFIRGPMRSRQPEEVREEVMRLARAGVKEFLLVSEDTLSYGRDLPSRPCLLHLLEELASLPEVGRIRLAYLYPTEVGPGLVETVLSLPSVASYFDLSFQHASEALLKRMGRPGGAGRFLELVSAIREREPGAAIRSSFILGFPGETWEDVEVLADFLDQAELDWVSFFPFSPEDGTPAARYPDAPSREEVCKRQEYLEEGQAAVVSRRASSFLGKVVEVLVERPMPWGGVGRSEREAPEVDGVVRVRAPAPLKKGTFVRAVVRGSDALDLLAEAPPGGGGGPEQGRMSARARGGET